MPTSLSLCYFLNFQEEFPYIDFFYYLENKCLSSKKKLKFKHFLNK